MYLDLEWNDFDDVQDENPSNEEIFIQEHDHVEPDTELIALDQKDIEDLPAELDGYEAFGGYTRHVPERFTQERDDRLMDSLIQKYSIEMKVDGKETREFFLNKEGAQAVANEVAETHKDAFAAAEDKQRFEEIWNHFDINHDDLVEVERMPQFLRMFLGNALAINLQ